MMLAKGEVYSVFGFLHGTALRLGFKLFIALLLIVVVQSSTIASTDVENENQIYEFHRHLPRYNRNGSNLRELAANAHDKTARFVSAPPAVGTITPDSPDGERLFNTEMCRADAILVGEVIAFKPLLSADNSTVFTDYKVTIDKIVENRSSVVLQVGKSVILTLNGGTFIADGLTIEQVGFDRPGPLIPSRKYLFLLKVLSDNTSFSTSGFFSIEYIDDTGLHVVSQHPFRDSVNRFLETYSLDSIEQHIRQTNCPSK